MADTGYISKIKVPTGDIYSIRDAELKNALDKKIFLDDRISGINGYGDLSVIKLSADEYADLLTSNALLSNAIYIVEDSSINAYGQQIKNLAEATDLSDAVNLEQLNAAIPLSVSQLINDNGYLSSIPDKYVTEEAIVPAVFRTIQLVKPKQNEGYRLHFRGDIARDDQFEDIIISGFDSASAGNYQYFKHFAVDGISGIWETMLSDGLYTDADDVPSYFSFADALSSIGETPSISSQYFLRYIWYYELSGVEHRSDQFSIAIPSNTAVGANPGDVIHKGEFYDLKQSVEPQKQPVGLDEDYNRYFICQSSKVNAITSQVSGEFDVLLDGYEAGKPYRIQFEVSQLSDATPKFYVDYGNGPELETGLSANNDSYVFKAGKKYYVELQNDILKVDTFGYNGNSGSSALPARYRLVNASLNIAGNSLSCAIEDHTITTIGISSSTTPIIVQFPPKAEDGARDFIVRVEISSSSAPGFTFIGVDESFTYDTDDDDWAIMEPGLNIISFTETK